MTEAAQDTKDERPLPAIEAARALAEQLLIEGKLSIDEIAEKTGFPAQKVRGIKGVLVRQKKIQGEQPAPSEEEEDGAGEDGEGGETEMPGGETSSKEEPSEDDAGVFKPPEVEIIEEVLGFLKERLQKISGIAPNARDMIVSTLKDEPTALRDANLLHSYIKSIAPKAYDAHLSNWVIKPLYTKYPALAQTVDAYLQATSAPGPVPPQYYTPQGQGWGSGQPYGPPYYGSPSGYQVPQRPPKRYKVVVDGQEIETDMEGFFAWQSYTRQSRSESRRQEEHDLKMKKLDIEIKQALEGKGGSAADQELKQELKEERQKREEEAEKRHQAQLDGIKDQLNQLASAPSFKDQFDNYKNWAEAMGFNRGGMTTIDLLNSFGEKIDGTVKQVVNRLPQGPGEFAPQVTRTPEEREEVAKKLTQQITKSGEIIAAENALLQAARSG